MQTSSTVSKAAIPAITIINGVTRLVPGTLGDPNSLLNESHNSPLLEYPQYTRPPKFREMKVPDILLSGNHKEIKDWRKNQMIKRTIERRDKLISSEINKNIELKKSLKGDVICPEDILNFKENNPYPDW